MKGSPLFEKIKALPMRERLIFAHLTFLDYQPEHVSAYFLQRGEDVPAAEVRRIYAETCEALGLTDPLHPPEDWHDLAQELPS